MAATLYGQQTVHSIQKKIHTHHTVSGNVLYFVVCWVKVNFRKTFAHTSFKNFYFFMRLTEFLPEKFHKCWRVVACCITFLRKAALHCIALQYGLMETRGNTGRWHWRTKLRVHHCYYSLLLQCSIYFIYGFVYICWLLRVDVCNRTFPLQGNHVSQLEIWKRVCNIFLCFFAFSQWI